jgi:hypothetical protein
MTVTDINTEEACQVSVSQAMQHMRPDKESEVLSVEETFSNQTVREVCGDTLH